MSSPIVQPLASLLQVNKGHDQPIFLQVANQLTTLIRNGRLQSGIRLPGSRQLAEGLGVNRQTVVKAYDELLAQGWLESHIGNGTFVANHLPDTRPGEQDLGAQEKLQPGKTAGFTFTPFLHLKRPPLPPPTLLHLDDGFPDARMAPLEELSRAYRSQLLMGNRYVRLGYGDTKGAPNLRQELSAYLNQTRGLKTTPDNILVVRGTMMGLYLACTGLLKAGDCVVLGELGWSGARMNFLQAGAQVLHVPVDEHGLHTGALEQLCQLHPVRMVYVTSHHHYPTTVAMRADRRMELLLLSETYGFIIFEDDYDYDFHYLGKPILPLAGADKSGRVLYCGSFTKTISPAFRVGYLVAPENVVQHLAELRRIIDRQGDQMLEGALAELLQQGIVQRHLRKSLRVYKERRDAFCALLKNDLRAYINFEVPDGGMAVWAKFRKDIDLPLLSQEAQQRGLYFSDGALPGQLTDTLNGTRLGFASSTSAELEAAVDILRALLNRK